MKSTDLYYSNNYQQFYDSTINVDVTNLYEHFFKYIPANAHILDFGCGSGRDAKAFIDKGFIVDAIDGSEELCRLASSFAGIEVKCMDFLDLQSTDEYDAIWACASILHVEKEKLPTVLCKMRDALHEKGIMYISFKYGDFEGERNGRYYVDMTSERFTGIAGALGLEIIEDWITEDVRQDNTGQWYNAILRK